MINFKVQKEAKSSGSIDTSITRNKAVNDIAKKLNKKYMDAKCELHPEFLNTVIIDGKSLSLIKEKFCCPEFSERIELKMEY